MQEWILKFVINLVAAWLIKKVGHTETAQHMADALEKHAPLSPDPLPSPAQLRKPLEPWLHG